MKIYFYESKQNLSKNIFLLLGRRYYDGIAHWFFFLLSLAMAFVLDDLDPHRKTEIYILKSFFFVDSIYSKTIDIIRRIIDFLFLNRAYV